MATIKQSRGAYLVVVGGRVLFHASTYEKAIDLARIVNTHPVIIA